METKTLIWKTSHRGGKRRQIWDPYFLWVVLYYLYKVPFILGYSLHLSPQKRTVTRKCLVVEQIGFTIWESVAVLIRITCPGP